MTAPSVSSREDVAATIWATEQGRDPADFEYADEQDCADYLELADAVLALYAPVVEQAGRDRVAVERVQAVVGASERFHGMVETVQLRRRIRAALGGDA